MWVQRRVLFGHWLCWATLEELEVEAVHVVSHRVKARCMPHGGLDLVALALVAERIQVFLELVKQRLYMGVLGPNKLYWLLGFVKASKSDLNFLDDGLEVKGHLFYLGIAFTRALSGRYLVSGLEKQLFEVVYCSEVVFELLINHTQVLAELLNERVLSLQLLFVQDRWMESHVRLRFVTGTNCTHLNLVLYV